MEESMNQLFTQAPKSRRSPALNVYSNDNGALVTAELPGIDLEKLEIEVEHETLHLKGELPGSHREEGTTVLRQESHGGHFERSLRLPFQVEAGEVEAGYEKGILTIRLPKAEEEKPRRITVKKN
jgi:HSP20 family protein